MYLQSIYFCARRIDEPSECEDFVWCVFSLFLLTETIILKIGEDTCNIVIRITL